MLKNGANFTHYIVLDEVVLGEALIVEKVTDWTSLALVRLALSEPKFSVCFAFVENRSLVPKIPN